MKKLSWTGVGVLLGAVAGLAQNTCQRSGPLTDQERWIRDEIQLRIDESIEAAEAKDLPAKMHYFAPDLTVKLVDGTVVDRKQIQEMMKRDNDWTLSVSDQTTIRMVFRAERKRRCCGHGPALRPQYRIAGTAVLTS
jgi:hypothetical protein